MDKNKPHEVWFNIENFTKSLGSLTICHLRLSQTRSVSLCSGDNSTQFSFDVTCNGQEVMLELMQKTMDNPTSLGYKIYKVEINRLYKVHKLDTIEASYSSEPCETRNIFRRIKLDFGRYILIPTVSDTDMTLMLRLYTEKNSTIRILTHDMPRNLLPFLAPKYPRYVTRVTVLEAHGLEKQDRFGCELAKRALKCLIHTSLIFFLLFLAANPYVVIHCGRQNAKSFPIHDALNPDFGHFSAIFYHDKLIPITVEVRKHSIVSF